MVAMQEYFNALSDFVARQLQDGEKFKVWFSGEQTDFVRFNRGLIRQSGFVQQAYFSLSLIRQQCHASLSLSLSCNLEDDQQQLTQGLQDLRGQLEQLPPDPHFLMAQEVNSSSHVAASNLPPSTQMVDEILALAGGHDMVGVLANGPLFHGFANSYGQRNWHQSASFIFDFSLYYSADKAVKTAYAGTVWSQSALAHKFARSVEQLEMLKRPPISVPPGAYRAYLTPTALGEMLGMLNWDGLGEKSLRTKQSSLRRMRDEGVVLDASIHLLENTAQGLAPDFQEDGFIKPPQVALIQAGRLVGSMIAPRTAQEYGLQANGADGEEALSAMDMAGGELAEDDILAQLGTGIYISNLWYLNFSDRSNCRMTGMTRFASFWVEDGQIKAPLNVMRFDDSLFKLLGEKLLGLTRETELLIDNDTYEARGDTCARVPGALVKDFNFVL